MLNKIKLNAGKIRLIFGLVLCCLLITFLDPVKIERTLAKTNVLLFLSAFFLFAGVMCVRALRWQYLLRDLKISSPLLNLLRIHLIGGYFNFFFPGGLAGDVYKIYDVSNTQSKRLRPLFATLVERITGVTTLSAISFISSFFFLDKLPGSACFLMIVSGGLVLVGFASLLLLPHAEPILNAFFRFIPAKINSKIPYEKLSSLNIISTELRSKYSLYIRTFFLSLILQFLVLLFYFIVASSLDSRITFWQILVFFPLIDLTAMIPLTVNGLGIKEALLVYFMKQNGIDPSFSMSMALLCRVVEITFAFSGGIVFHFTKKPAAGSQI